MKKLITFCFLLTITFSVCAQKHDNSEGACRLFKNKAIGDGAFCPACRAQDEKETKARDVENKRRNDVIIAKAQAEKKAQEIAEKKSHAEREAKNKVTEVFVNMAKTPSSVAKQAEKPVKKVPVKLGKDIQLYAGWGMGMFNHNSQTNVFLNENKDTVLKSDDYLKTYAVIGENKNNFPKNTGIVLLKQTNKLPNGKEINIADIVDLKGKRYFNDNSISTIFHLADDYFVVCRSPNLLEWRTYGNNHNGYEDVEVYNLKTKKSTKFVKDDARYTKISIYVGGRKMGEPGLEPFLSRMYANYDEDVYCLDGNREMVVKKIPRGSR